jgi:hypothetical protein
VQFLVVRCLRGAVIPQPVFERRDGEQARDFLSIKSTRAKLNFMARDHVMVKLQRATAMVNSQNRLFECLGPDQDQEEDQGHQ